MGYLHIENLYRPSAQYILLFKEVFCLEKIHGSSSHLSYIPTANSGCINYFSGGESYERFVALFNTVQLLKEIKTIGLSDKEFTIFGEVFGGKCQGMSATYGKELRFVAFDVKVGDCWLSVLDAEKIVQSLGLEFVHYVKTTTDLKELDAQRDAPSVQAVRNGITEPKPREGIVIRPLVEFTMNNGARVIAKHKGEAFSETKTPRHIVDPSKLKVLEDAESVANEWVTAMRLSHVLQSIPNHGMEKMREILSAMVEDVMREGAGEIVDSPAVRKAICSKTAVMYKNLLKSSLC